ncbi:hypothetical protein [Actinoplanes sp. URMC 104]|uniref:hypothetical protein n=1 Tax=Actinoplanes sp. URMC 104 TaxID=3423409 RepID=UPI003F1DA7E2
MVNSWNLLPGDYLTRQERAVRFGGSTMGGIQPSARSPHVFVYSDPAEGHQNGYIFDGWSKDRSVFLYTGEGRHGDQKLISGNAAILNHKQQGRVLRVFVADGKVENSGAKNQLYIGAFEVDNEIPYVVERAPDADGIQRSVIVFRLRPMSDPIIREADISETDDAPQDTESALVDLKVPVPVGFRRVSQEEAVVERREADLVQRYARSLGPAGLELKRWRIRPGGSLLTLYTGPYYVQKRELYEAKASSTREDIRMALGQIFDYERWISPRPIKKAVLTPSKPAPDLIDLLHHFDVGVVFETADGTFRRLDPPLR